MDRARLITSNARAIALSAYKLLRLYIHNHSFISALILSSLYMAIFQWNFLASGDAWAESFAEYIDESVRYGWGEVIAQNWAGYFTIVPSAIAKLYVALGGPLGYADYFMRWVVIVFTIISSSLVACHYNRSLIQNDALRILLAVGLIAILHDVASFSFINVWYIGFVPIILYTLNPQRLSRSTDLSLGIYGALVALTKPFIALLPLILYRLIRTRQYLGSGIVLLATAVQSYQILFNDRRQITENSQFDPLLTLGAIFTTGATAFYKLFHIVPASVWWLVFAWVILAILLVIIWRTKGFWVAGGLALIFIYSLYIYALSPDKPSFSGISNFQNLYNFNFATQREIPINAMLLVFLAIAGDHLASLRRRFKLPGGYHLSASLFAITLAIGILAAISRPVDTISAAVTNSPFQSFRQQLNNRQPSCVPLAPSTAFYEYAIWAYSYKGVCRTMTHDPTKFSFNFKRMDMPLDGTHIRYDANRYYLSHTNLHAIVIPAINRQQSTGTISLQDTVSKKRYQAQIRSQEDLQLITFNTTGLTPRNSYDFVITTRVDAFGTKFVQSKELATYPYFLENRQPPAKP